MRKKNNIYNYIKKQCSNSTLCSVLLECVYFPNLSDILSSRIYRFDIIHYNNKYVVIKRYSNLVNDTIIPETQFDSIDAFLRHFHKTILANCKTSNFILIPIIGDNTIVPYGERITMYELINRVSFSPVIYNISDDLKAPWVKYLYYHDYEQRVDIFPIQRFHQGLYIDMISDTYEYLMNKLNKFQS